MNIYIQRLIAPCIVLAMSACVRDIPSKGAFQMVEIYSTSWNFQPIVPTEPLRLIQDSAFYLRRYQLVNDAQLFGLLEKIEFKNKSVLNRNNFSSNIVFLMHRNGVVDTLALSDMGAMYNGIVYSPDPDLVALIVEYLPPEHQGNVRGWLKLVRGHAE